MSPNWTKIETGESQLDTIYDGEINAPTHVQVGIPFEFSVAFQRFAASRLYAGHMSFRSSDPLGRLPSTTAFTGTEATESRRFTAVLNSPGVHRIEARCSPMLDGVSLRSNPIICGAELPRSRLFWGDFHWHTELSDGRGTLDDNYIYGRDAANLDVVSSTDHDPDEDVWALTKDKAASYYVPGKFVTFPSYEWTGHRGNNGHLNVFWLSDEAPTFPSAFYHALYSDADHTVYEEVNAFYQAVRKTKIPVLLIPHHPAAHMFPYQWNAFDPELEPVVEIYSCWGGSEYYNNPRPIKYGGMIEGHSVQDALARGLIVGFTGGSDSHSGRVGYMGGERSGYDTYYSYRDPMCYPGGITAISTTELTREGIFNALRERHCYATTGKRIFVEFEADGHTMGSVFKTSSRPELSVYVEGTAPIESVTLVHNNKDEHVYCPEAPAMDARFVYNQTSVLEGRDWYYVRVVQTDGEMAWSSPIWVESK